MARDIHGKTEDLCGINGKEDGGGEAGEQLTNHITAAGHMTTIIISDWLARPQLAEVSILVPGVSKGGPGVRKRVLSDLQLESVYKDITGTELVCSKCDKRSPIGKLS